MIRSRPLVSSMAAVLVTSIALAPVAKAWAAGCAASVVDWTAPAALVLSGGGAKGAWEAGVAVALLEAGLPLALVAGSSAGALNAAMIAAGRAERLEGLWRGMERDKLYHLRAPILFAGFLPGWLTLLALDRAGSLLDATPLRDLIALSTESATTEATRRSCRRLR